MFFDWARQLVANGRNLQLRQLVKKVKVNRSRATRDDKLLHCKTSSKLLVGFYRVHTFKDEIIINKDLINVILTTRSQLKSTINLINDRK